MALQRYVITSAVTIPAGTPAIPAAGEPETGGAAGYGNAATSSGYGVFPQSFQPGTAIILDPASALYSAIGSANLRPYVQGSDDVGHSGISN